MNGRKHGLPLFGNGPLPRSGIHLELSVNTAFINLS